MLTVRTQVIDGTGTFTLSDSQPCRLLTMLTEMPNDAAAEKPGSAEHGDGALVRVRHGSNSPAYVGADSAAPSDGMPTDCRPRRGNVPRFVELGAASVAG
jgi:hypothetical protein